MRSYGQGCQQGVWFLFSFLFTLLQRGKEGLGCFKGFFWVGMTRLKCSQIPEYIVRRNG